MKKCQKGTNVIYLAVDRIAGGQVYLQNDEVEIIIPERFLPREIAPEKKYVITIATEEAEAERQEIKAKEILNEILKVEKD